jgi:hypothetical protein
VDMRTLEAREEAFILVSVATHMLLILCCLGGLWVDLAPGQDLTLDMNILMFKSGEKVGVLYSLRLYMLR